MDKNCPCTPVVEATTKLDGRMDLVDERFKNSIAQIHAVSENVQRTSEQIDLGLRTILQVQHTITSQNERLSRGQARLDELGESVSELEECIRQIPDLVRESFNEHKKVEHSKLNKLVRKLGVMGFAAICFVLSVHGKDAWALIKTIL